MQQLQNKSIRIENTIKNLSQEMVKEVLERVIESELAIPHPDSEIQNLRENTVRENIFGKWQSLSDWFISSEKCPSESQRVLDITDEVIRKIIQNAALIVQLQNWGISRKEDYKKFIQLFAQCENMEAAHKLSAHVFGIQHVRHFKVNSARSTDSINSGVFDETPSEYELKPHIRTYKSRIHKSGFESKALEKLAQRNQYLKRLEEDKQLVTKYIKNQQLDISQIDDCISAATRETLLRWIAQANLTASKSGRTEYGQVYHITKREGSHTLKCEDGELVMPIYVFQFEDE